MAMGSRKMPINIAGDTAQVASRFDSSEISDTDWKKSICNGRVNTVAEAVTARVDISQWQSLRRSLLRGSFSLKKPIMRGEKRIIPNVLKKDSKKEAEHRAKGLNIPMTAPAAVSEVMASYSAFIKNATAKNELIMSARTIDGENPVIAANASISGSDMTIAAFLGKIKQMMASKIDICIPDTAAMWDRPLDLSEAL